MRIGIMAAMALSFSVGAGMPADPGPVLRDDIACPDVWEPVCGVDGHTYSNMCYARRAGVPIAHEGECGGGGGRI